MELYHLRTFVTVAEEGHLTRASERLFTSQPAVSAHIKALEEELGVTLFERTPRGMQLTPAGDRLLATARTTLASTNDIYTQEDARFLIHSQALEESRIIGVETGGCPHTAIREDASMNLAAVEDLCSRFPNLDLVFIESGGDNLSATFSPELADLTIYVLDVAEGEKMPRKGGPGITRSDLLVINKIDLAPYVGASLEVMEQDTLRMRKERPFVFSNMKTGEGLEQIVEFIEYEGMLSD